MSPTIKSDGLQRKASGATSPIAVQAALTCMTSFNNLRPTTASATRATICKQGGQPMKRRCVSLACLAILAAAAAEAAVVEEHFQARTTGDLLALCSAGPTDSLRTASINFCHGFGVGVYHVLQEQAAAGPSMRLFCAPEPMPSRNDAIAGFVQWARAHPGEMSSRPADGLVRFLVQQYPCPPKR